MLARRQRVRAFGLVHRRRRQPLVGGQRLRQLRCRRAHLQHIRRPVAEGDAQPHRQQNGKDRRSRRSPPARAETAGSAPSSIDRGCSFRAYSSRRFLPVRRTKTSSSVAEWVRNSLRCSPCSFSAAKMRGTAVCSSLTESWCSPASTRCDCTPGIASQQRRHPRLHARSLHVPLTANSTMSSPPTEAISCCGVPSAITLPWSMIATRSQSRSASSM